MTKPDLETLLSWRGRTVLDREGDKLGRLGALYLDGASEQPAFAGIHTGLFGRHESIVPLDDIAERGEDLWIPYAADTVKASPNVDPDAVLGEEDEERLRAHYRVAPRTEAELIRSEEEVTQHVVPMQPQERVRLRKVLVTENVTQVVPQRREVVQLETDPPPEGGVEVVEDDDTRGGRAG